MNTQSPNRNPPDLSVGRFNTVFGDATKPGGKGPRFICHVVNDIGAWGAGFVLSLSKVDQRPEKAYREWSAHRDHSDSALFESGSFTLGEIQLVPFDQEAKTQWVVNMIAQHGIYVAGGIPPIRYDALGECMRKVAEKAKEMSASIHSPMFGCGRAKGKWEIIERMIIDEWCSKSISVTIYKF